MRYICDYCTHEATEAHCSSLCIMCKKGRYKKVTNKVSPSFISKIFREAERRFSITLNKLK